MRSAVRIRYPPPRVRHLVRRVAGSLLRKPDGALPLQAGVVYAVLTFLVGFVVGAVRVLFLVPRLGAPVAVAIETPFMLVASWLLCAWSVRRYKVSSKLAARAIMSGSAFVVLMTLELALSVLVFHRSIAQHFGAYMTVAGIIGLGAQIIFALIPSIQARIH